MTYGWLFSIPLKNSASAPAMTSRMGYDTSPKLRSLIYSYQIEHDDTFRFIRIVFEKDLLYLTFELYLLL